MLPDRTVASATSMAVSGTEVMSDQSVDFQKPSDAVPLRVAVLGSTGSIGKNTLEVIAASEGRFKVHLLCGHRSVEAFDRLRQQHQAAERSAEYEKLHKLVKSQIVKHDFPGRWPQIVEKISIYLQNPEPSGQF